MVGLSGSQVVGRLFESHGVTRFTYTKFNPESTYPMDANQPFWWSDWTDESALRKLSEDIVKETTSFKSVIEGDKFVACEILGIGSKVELRTGAIKHLKALDLALSIDEDAVTILKGIGLSSGILLKTERSFHYYDCDLLSENDWRVWIKALIDSPESESIFGTEYLSMCLLRGYSALRIFGYDGTSKSKTPVVIAKL